MGAQGSRAAFAADRFLEAIDFGLAQTMSCVTAMGPLAAARVAFSRTGDPATGDFGDATVIRKFRNVPDSLSAL